MIKEIPINTLTIQDLFWKNYQNLVTKTVIPYQYQVLDDAIDVDVQAERMDSSLPSGKSHALNNFKIAAGKMNGEHFGWIFQDSDVYKWLEAVGYSLLNHRDSELEELADDVIGLIGKAQEKDGYLNTFFQLKKPKLKYRMLYFSHELYCAGHLIEAGIAYDQATGKSALLDVAKMLVSNIEKHFGYEKNKICGADGHQEIELALVRLYEYTSEQKYLDLANFFIEVRGEDPNFYQKEVNRNIKEKIDDNNPIIDTTYLQAKIQPKYQYKAEGHAVRMLYMATGMAKIAQHTKNKELVKACREIWNDITKRKMYITAGVGSTVHGEAFVGEYDLPNDTMYCETCASIALIYFAYEMFKIGPKSEYIEVLERALYNGVLSGSAIDGKHFFYVNPLEVHQDSCHHNPGKGHVKVMRPEWLGCACCPPNFSRLVLSLQKYIYIEQNESIYLNLFVQSQLKLDDFEITQTTNFPYENTVCLNAIGQDKELYIRKPKWSKNIHIKTKSCFEETFDYFIVKINGSVDIEICFEQPILSIRSNPKVWNNSNSLAIQRGPFVYCGESIDNSGDLFLYRIALKNMNLANKIETSEILDRTLTLKIPAYQIKEWDHQELYQIANSEELVERKLLTLIPYHLWGNRGLSNMRIWFPEYNE